jgi:hypothetical protein
MRFESFIKGNVELLNYHLPLPKRLFHELDVLVFEGRVLRTNTDHLAYPALDDELSTPEAR